MMMSTECENQLARMCCDMWANMETSLFPSVAKCCYSEIPVFTGEAGFRFFALPGAFVVHAPHEKSAEKVAWERGKQVDVARHVP